MWFFSPVLLNFLVTIRLLFGNNGTMILSKTFSKLNDNEVIFLYWVCGSTLFLKTDFRESWGLSYKCKQTILFFLFLLFESECFAVIFCCWSGVRSHSKKKNVLPSLQASVIWGSRSKLCFLALFQIPFLLWRVWTGNKDVFFHLKDCEHSCLIVQINGWKLPTVCGFKSACS